MLGHQSERPLLQLKLGAFLDPDLGLLGRPPEGSEHRHVGIEPHAIVPPMASSDHPAIEVEDALQFGAIE